MRRKERRSVKNKRSSEAEEYLKEGGRGAVGSRSRKRSHEEKEKEELEWQLLQVIALC